MGLLEIGFRNDVAVWAKILIKFKSYRQIMQDVPKNLKGNYFLACFIISLSLFLFSVLRECL